MSSANPCRGRLTETGLHRQALGTLRIPERGVDWNGRGSAYRDPPRISRRNLSAWRPFSSVPPPSSNRPQGAVSRWRGDYRGAFFFSWTGRGPRTSPERSASVRPHVRPMFGRTSAEPFRRSCLTAHLRVGGAGLQFSTLRATVGPDQQGSGPVRGTMGIDSPRCPVVRSARAMGVPQARVQEVSQWQRTRSK